MPASKKTPVELTITREQFKLDPRAAFGRLSAGGRLVITEGGMPVAVISSPSERIEVSSR